MNSRASGRFKWALILLLMTIQSPFVKRLINDFHDPWFMAHASRLTTGRDLEGCWWFRYLKIEKLPNFLFDRYETHIRYFEDFYGDLHHFSVLVFEISKLQILNTSNIKFQIENSQQYKVSENQKLERSKVTK